MAAPSEVRQRVLRDPTWLRALFDDRRWAWFWLIARVYIGWLWLESGWEKLQSEAWMSTGVALRGAWERIAAPPQGANPPVAYDWYRAFIDLMLDAGWHPWFAKVIVLGEVIVGVALILGALTGIAALLGAFMNWNFAMGGMGPAVNAVMLIIAIGVLFAWKTAGWWGLDRWLLPVLGTPWQPGTLFAEGRTPPAWRAMRPLEQWTRMLVGVALALWALANLDGVLQVLVLLTAAGLVAITGLGWLRVFRTRDG